MRRGLLSLAPLALFALACGASTTETGLPVGLVAAPMLTPGARSAALGVDGGADASSGARRAMPPEPQQPAGMTCRRNVSCHEEEDELPVVPLPPPFERCATSAGKGDAGFSAAETTAQRQWEPHTCCYVEWLDCKRGVRR